MTETRIRQAAVEDAGTVGSLLWRFNAEFDEPSPSAATFTQRFGPLLARDDVIVLLATREAAVGFAYLTLRPTPYFDGPLAQLEELYVIPELRGDGIGTQLLGSAMRRCRDQSSQEMHINVDEDDTDTRRFYERHGFANHQPGSEWRMFFYERSL